MENKRSSPVVVILYFCIKPSFCHSLFYEVSNPDLAYLIIGIRTWWHHFPLWEINFACQLSKWEIEIKGMLAWLDIIEMLNTVNIGNNHCQHYWARTTLERKVLEILLVLSFAYFSLSILPPTPEIL